MKAHAAKASAQKPVVSKTPLVVLGATGGVGRGVVEAAIAAGRPVIAVARDQAGLKCLRAQFAQADINVIAGEISTDADGQKLATALRKLGRPIGGVVAAVSGPVERARLLDHPAAFLRQRLDEDLLPHLSAARHLLPLLAEGNRGGTYVLIGGPCAEQPWAGYGHRSIAAAALRMLARVLHEEARSFGVRVQLLSVESPVQTDLNSEHACANWPSALSVGQRALALIEPVRAQPADAVVRYRDVDASSLHNLHVESAVPESSSLHGSTEPTPPGAVVDPPVDRDALLPTRCLQDARTLLKNLIQPDNHPKQEAP